jgi:aminoglycoside 6'-N-acetyltransferase I
VDVVPSHRRKGIGRALIQSAESWASGAGFSELASDAECDNHDAVHVHKALGFREVGRSVQFVRRLRGPGPDRASGQGRLEKEDAG